MGCGAEEATHCFNVRVSSSSCSVMLKHALSYMHLVFLFSRRVRGGDTDFLLIGTVFQRATRRKAHCLFVVALMELFLFSLSCCDCVRVSTLCVLREVGHCHCRDFFIFVGQLESRFTWVLKAVFLKALCSFQHISF